MTALFEDQGTPAWPIDRPGARRADLNKYSPDQAREPAGTPEGGEFAGGGDRQPAFGFRRAPLAGTPASRGELWKGFIKGGSAKQQDIVRKALAYVPARLLRPGMSVEFVPHLASFRNEVFGITAKDGTTIRLNSSVYRVGRAYSADQFAFDTLHEAGHAVAGYAGSMGRAAGLGYDLTEMRAAQPDFTHFGYLPALRSPDEAWAEGFASRLTTGRSYGPASDAVFRKLGV